MTYRIGICGYATAGKDEAARALVERLDFVSVNMSHALQRDIDVLDPWIKVDDREDGSALCRRLSALRAEFTYDEAKQRFLDYRETLQVYGTEVHRAIDPNYWVRRAAAEADKYARVVTTGVRFLNERTGIDYLIYVERPGVGPINGHVSDAGMAEVIATANATIVNDGTVEELHDKIVTLVEGLLDPTLLVPGDWKSPR